MSLDISLRILNHKYKEWKENLERSLKEVKEHELFNLLPTIEQYYSDRQPLETIEVFEGNITHNLVDMAEKAGLYYCIWRPEEQGIKIAKDLIDPLERGLKDLTDKPEKYKLYNPPNGWGSYETLVSFIDRYLAACKENPEAEIYAWR